MSPPLLLVTVTSTEPWHKTCSSYHTIRDPSVHVRVADGRECCSQRKRWCRFLKFEPCPVPENSCGTSSCPYLASLRFLRSSEGGFSNGTVSRSVVRMTQIRIFIRNSAALGVLVIQRDMVLQCDVDSTIFIINVSSLSMSHNVI